ncbi:MAG: heliorhodopsin HeR [Anaerolineaceae bacterium]|nr:heliorhodopsin HeR [Anaerolineaceae bacterium]
MANAAVKDQKTQDKKFEGLRRFNLVMGFFHLVQGILMIVLSNDTTYPSYIYYLKFNLETFSLEPNPTLFFELLFGPAVAVFLLLSAVAHFSLATFGYKQYVKNLKLGKNPVRFYEYALSSSWMIVLIGMLTGIWDIGALIAMLGVNAAMNLFGLLMEELNQNRKKVDWKAFIYGCIVGIIPWVIIGTYFIGSIANSTSPETKPPDFVYAIIPTLFVFFNIFALNMFLQYKKVGPWKDYLFGEKVYIVLSLTAKTVLAWMIFSGTLAPI